MKQGRTIASDSYRSAEKMSMPSYDSHNNQDPQELVTDSHKTSLSSPSSSAAVPSQDIPNDNGSSSLKKRRILTSRNVLSHLPLQHRDNEGTSNLSDNSNNSSSRTLSGGFSKRSTSPAEAEIETEEKQSYAFVPSIFRGLVTGALSVSIYAIFLFLFSSLFLLVSGMETGTDLSAVNLSFTSLLLLLSQGLVVTTGMFNIGVYPLGLTLISLLILRIVFIKRPGNLLSGVTASCVWAIFFSFVAHNYQQSVSSPWWSVFCYPGIVSLVAYAWSCTEKNSSVYHLWSKWIKKHISATVQRTILLGLYTARRIAYAYIILAFITVFAWIITGYESMTNVFSMLHMNVGSRIMTSIFTLAWLPNLLIWALSWLFGATFVIGNVGSFNLWFGQSEYLPPIPIFAIFPDAIASHNLRTTILIIPVIIVSLIGLYTLFIKKEHGILLTAPSSDNLQKNIINYALGYVYPIGSFIIAVLIMVLSCGLLLSISSGSIGVKNLSFIGIHVNNTWNYFTKPIQWGLTISWLLAVLYGIIRYLIIILIKKSEHSSLNSSELLNNEENNNFSDTVENDNHSFSAENTSLRIEEELEDHYE